MTSDDRCSSEAAENQGRLLQPACLCQYTPLSISDSFFHAIKKYIDRKRERERKATKKGFWCCWCLEVLHDHESAGKEQPSALARDLVELELEAGACMMHPGEEQVMVSQEFLIDP